VQQHVHARQIVADDVIFLTKILANPSAPMRWRTLSKSEPDPQVKSIRLSMWAR